MGGHGRSLAAIARDPRDATDAADVGSGAPRLASLLAMVAPKQNRFLTDLVSFAVNNPDSPDARDCGRSRAGSRLHEPFFAGGTPCRRTTFA
jgi:hypothetical protein